MALSTCTAAAHDSLTGIPGLQVKKTVKKAEPEDAQTDNPLDTVFVSSEVAPWSKTGGLGDVVGSLPIALAKRGHRVMVVAPR